MSKPRVAVIGAGVSGLTCGVVLAERGWSVAILADAIGPRTTSAAAGAIWFPYDAEPADKVIAWSLTTYERLCELAHEPKTGVSMLKLRCFARAGELPIPTWARKLGARRLVRANDLSDRRRAEADVEGRSRREMDTEFPPMFTSGFIIDVPLTDTSRYLDYLRERFVHAGGTLRSGIYLHKLAEVRKGFGLIVNCAGIGARELVEDRALEPHRGQIVIVPKLDLPHAIVCDDSPLMYAIPRRDDCVFGGTNQLDDNQNPTSADTISIVNECSRILNISPPPVIAERVGLRPYRKSGVRLEIEMLCDGRTVIHNYGHGGSGFTLSWGCAEELLKLAQL